jgi:hypothetical protein
MRYLLLVCIDGTVTPDDGAAMRASTPAWVHESSGVRLGGHALAEPATAATVRVRDGETIVTDGPFAETKEHVAGFDVLDCADLDEAIEVAAKHPVSWYHMVEVRPFAGAWPPAQPPKPWKDPVPLNRPVPAGHRRYVLLPCVDGIAGTDAEEASIVRDGTAWRTAREESGAQVFGHPLMNADTATTVRVRNGETLLSDGPFVETKEFIGGIDVLDCASREHAIELAAAHPLARFHMIEVRPFAGDPLGDGSAANSPGV